MLTPVIASDAVTVLEIQQKFVVLFFCRSCGRLSRSGLPPILRNCQSLAHINSANTTNCKPERLALSWVFAALPKRTAAARLLPPLIRSVAKQT